MIEPIGPIDPDKFKPLDTNIVFEFVDEENMPQPKSPDKDLSEGNVFDKSYQKTQDDTQAIGDAVNESNILLEELKAKQDEVIAKQVEIINQVNANVEQIEENKTAIAENKQAIEDNASDIESLQEDVNTLFKPAVTEINTNNSFNIPAGDETLVLEFNNNAGSKFNLNISASIQLVEQVNDLTVSLKVNGVEKYTALSTFTFPNFDIEPNSGKIELYLVNSSQQAINSINAIANINVRGV